MKTLLLLPLAIGLGAASAPPQAEVKTGRSVAIDAPRQYWLSSDLNRLFLQKPVRDEAAGTEKAPR